jgi:hypothetical protein
MDIWLELVRDHEELEKEKKTRDLTEKGKKKAAVIGIRDTMSQTFRQRRTQQRAAEEVPSEGSSPTEERESTSAQPNKDRRGTDHISEGDKAFASQRRTADRILSSFKEGDECTAEQMNSQMDRHEALEREKMELMKDFLQRGRERPEDSTLRERVVGLENENEEIRELIRGQGQDLQDAMRQQSQQIDQKLEEQTQRTDQKLDELLQAILQQRR